MFEVALSGTLNLATLYSIPLEAGAVYVVDTGSEPYVSVDSVTGVVTPLAEGTGVVLIQDGQGVTWQRVFISVLSSAESGIRQQITANQVSVTVSATVPQTEESSLMTTDIGFLGGHRLIHDSVADAKLKTITSAGKVANSATSATALNTGSAIVARDADGDFAARMITLSGLPTQSGHVATKGYVDSVSQGLDVKASVRAATTAPITLSGTQTVDGVELVAGDRVLVKNQASASANGIYVVAAGAWARAADASDEVELSSGAFTFVEEGTVNADSGFVMIEDAPAVNGYSFAQFSGTGSFTGGDGITQLGTTFSVVAADGTIVVDETGVRVGEIADANVAAAAAIAWSKIAKTGSSLADLATRSAGDLSSGTLADGRLSSNVPLKDALSNTFVGDIVAGSFSGDGSALTDLDADAINAGTLADARLSANVPLKDAVANVFTGDIEAAAFSGSGSALTDLNASELTMGTVPLAALSGITNTEIAADAAIAWSKIAKTGSSLADLATRSAGDLSSGTLADARLSANVPLKDALTNTFTGAIVADSFSGDMDAADLTSGTVPLARLSGITNTEIAADAAIAWSKLSKTGSSLADLATRSAGDLSSGTLADARLSANVPLKDALANVFTGDIQAAAFDGDGSALTDLNASELTSGTVPLARLSGITNTEIAANAAIAYSKLDLTGSIVNADIAAGAAIADTKLATISTAGKVANSATTGTASAVADTLVLRDANGRAKFADPAAAADAATKGYVDDKEIRNETPTGTIDGSNLAFTIANSPMAGSVQVFVSGLMMLSGTHYSVSGTTITFTDPYQPITGEWVRVSYRKA